MMKKVRFYSALPVAAAGFLAVIFLFSCGRTSLEYDLLPLPSAIPSETVYDVSRGVEDFSFESYVSVSLDLTVSVLGFDGVKTPGEAGQAVIVSVVTEQGSELYRGLISEEGHLSGSFGIATRVPSVLLSLSGPGIRDRVFTIQNPASLVEIRRDIEVAALGAAERDLASDTADRDGDGVPDIYDAYPDDPAIAFEIAFPGDGSKVFTVAYEDNFPNLGDGDYNDFVGSYSLSVRGLSNKIYKITGTATAMAKVAGYDHEFGLMLRIPNAVATLDTTLNGVAVLEKQPVSGDIRIPLFTSTAEATSEGVSEATFTIQFSLSPGVPFDAMPAAPFDPYLFIHNTGYDVHLIGQSPLPGSPIDESEDYRDGDGFPRVMLVPGNFAPPQEVTSILDAYPRFQDWIDFEGGFDAEGVPTADWYFYPDENLVMNIGQTQ